MKVTIAICAYNAAETIGRALESACAQIFPSDEFEIVIIDDGSTDDTTKEVIKVARNYPELPKIHCHRSIQNEGLPAAANKALMMALGKYFVRLDADDTMQPDLLSKTIPYLESDVTDMVSSERWEIENGKESLFERPSPFALRDMVACGVVMRTDMLRTIGGYRRLFWEEYDLYIRYLNKSGRPGYHVAHPLYTYYKHDGAMTADSDAVLKGWEELTEIWGRHTLEKHGLP